jgi:type IX secretion system PorP/SprF family membrane protein
MKTLQQRFAFCILIFASAVLSIGDSFAQDIHFSQFYETPSLLNPALTGVSNNLRGSLQYKNQWGSVTVPYKTFAASFEMKFNQKDWEGNGAGGVHKSVSKNLAGGISFLSDKAGDGAMGTTQVTFSLASQVFLDAKNSLGVGLQASLAQKSIDQSKLIWPNQYNGSSYDQSINPVENFSSGKFIYGDYAAGILWTYGKGEMYMTANDEIKANAGVTLHHINRPKESYISDISETANMRFVVHGGLVFGIKNTSVGIAPSFMLNYQGTSKEIIFGSLFKYALRDDSKYTGNIKSAMISIGGYYRNNDAIIPTLLLEMGQYAFGLSYDINVSDLHVASNYHGGVEIMLRFSGSNPFLYQSKPRL